MGMPVSWGRAATSHAGGGYRGYGASESAGPPSEAGLNADAKAAWDHLTRGRGVSPAKIVIYGWSLGSGPAVSLAAAQRPAALITEGAYTSLPDVGAARYPWVPVRLVMRNRFDNLERARTLDIPWLLFHARQDEQIPYEQSEMLAKAAPNARLVSLSAGHGDGVIADRAMTLGTLRSIAERLGGIRNPQSAQ
jgi:fermentation-respiration switch protein FrsA (DUF1100 family)